MEDLFGGDSDFVKEKKATMKSSFSVNFVLVKISSASLTDRSVISLIERLCTVTANTSGFSRAPLQV